MLALSADVTTVLCDSARETADQTLPPFLADADLVRADTTYDTADQTMSPKILWDPAVLQESGLLVYWRNADDASADVGTSLVSRQTDRVHSFVLTSPTTPDDNRPTLVPSGAGKKPWIRYGGGQFAQSPQIPPGAPVGRAHGAMFTLCDQAAPASDTRTRTLAGYGSTNNNRRLGRGKVGSAGRVVILAGLGSATDETIDFSSIQAAWGVFTSRNLSSRLNGVDTSPVGCAWIETPSAGRTTVGGDTSSTPVGKPPAANGWQGSERHFMIFGAAPPTATILKLEAWALYDVGLQQLLPTTHPYRTIPPMFGPDDRLEPPPAGENPIVDATLADSPGMTDEESRTLVLSDEG
jgi:hypothetical protein